MTTMREAAKDAPPPLFTIKASDAFAFPMVHAYHSLCIDYGLENQAQQVKFAAQEIQTWQAANPDRVHLPSHTHVPQLPEIHDGNDDQST